MGSGDLPWSGASASGEPAGQVVVHQGATDRDRYFFDFDPAAPGGQGGASFRCDWDRGLVSIDGVYRNINLPPRSTGRLLADGLQQVLGTNIIIIEAYNVERTTPGSSMLAALARTRELVVCWKIRSRP